MFPLLELQSQELLNGPLILSELLFALLVLGPIPVTALEDWLLICGLQGTPTSGEVSSQP